MSNLIKRTITGIIFVTVLIAAIYLNQISCLILFGILTLLGIWEFYNLVLRTGAKAQKVLGTLAGVMLFSILGLSFYEFIEFKYIVLTIPFLFILFCTELYRNKDYPFTNIGFTLLGIIYIAFPFACLIYLSSFSAHDFLNQYNPQVLMGYFILLWANDTGAYLFGRQFGKTKLFERISPNKTWEGAIGGALLSVGISFLLAKYFYLLDFQQWMVIALLVVVFGNLGDLAESLFKRSIQIKDSGTILPGHGGILDRFDGVLVSAPMVFTYLYLYC